MVNPKIFKFTQGNWNDGIWGQEEQDGVYLTYMGKLVLLTNTNNTKKTITLPFSVWGNPEVTIAGLDTVIRIRK